VSVTYVLSKKSFEVGNLAAADGTSSFVAVAYLGLDPPSDALAVEQVGRRKAAARDSHAVRLRVVFPEIACTDGAFVGHGWSRGSTTKKKFGENG